MPRGQMSRFLASLLVDKRNESSVNAVLILVVISNVLEVILVLIFLAIVLLIIASEMLITIHVANHIGLHTFAGNPK